MKIKSLQNKMKNILNREKTNDKDKQQLLIAELKRKNKKYKRKYKKFDINITRDIELMKDVLHICTTTPELKCNGIFVTKGKKNILVTDLFQNSIGGNYVK